MFFMADDAKIASPKHQKNEQHPHVYKQDYLQSKETANSFNLQIKLQTPWKSVEWQRIYVLFQLQKSSFQFNRVHGLVMKNNLRIKDTRYFLV